MDYSMELATDFPPNMVLEMQKNAAKKARRTIIGRKADIQGTPKVLQSPPPSPFLHNNPSHKRLL
jgi:hypothetical protein